MISYDQREKWIDRAKKAAKMYSEGFSVRDIMKTEDLSGVDYKRAKRLGFIVARSLSEANKIARKKYGANSPGPAARKRLSKRMSEYNPGGRSKWYKIAGKKVQGTWERNFALFLEENQIPWERCKSWKYIINGKEKRYTPDFYIPHNDLYVEIKGHWWNNDRQKMDCIIKQYPNKNILIIEDKNFATQANLVKALG